MIIDQTLEQRERARVAALMQQPNAVFVFGSNTAGMHAGGAARVAFDEYGAAWGQGEGIQGRSYALPTMDADFEPLPLQGVQAGVQRLLLACALFYADRTFAITRVGCGIARFTDDDIAPLFNGALERQEKERQTVDDEDDGQIDMEDGPLADNSEVKVAGRWVPATSANMAKAIAHAHRHGGETNVRDKR